MAVCVMHIGNVGMLVAHPLVTVQMRMRLSRRVFARMRVLVVRIMHVWMRMFHRLMLMLVAMVLGQVQPDSERHEQSRCQQQIKCP